MQLWKKVLSVILALASAALVALIFVIDSKIDNKGPEITFGDDAIKVSVNSSETTLLEDVKAVDGNDGDVSDTLVVDNLSDFDDNGVRTITYAAYDKSGNVSKATRKISYTDYESPKFSLKSSPVFSSSDYNINLGELLEANDVFDGDITPFIKLKDENITVGQAGKYFAEVTVYNSAGDFSTIKLPVFIDNASVGQNAPLVHLSTYFIYLKKGSRMPDLIHYIESVQEHANRVDLNKDPKTLEKVYIDASNVNLNEKGCYYVNYEYTNEEKITSVTRLIVAVE